MGGLAPDVGAGGSGGGKLKRFLYPIRPSLSLFSF